MVSLKAIETRYDGCRFRSRLEARWRVFFNELGLISQYEPEGFDLGQGYGWYLPDFYLPRQDLYLEIKPTFPPTMDELKKMGRLVSGFGIKGFIAIGEPGLWNEKQHYPSIIFTHVKDGRVGSTYDGLAWQECYACRGIDIAYQAETPSDRWFCRFCARGTPEELEELRNRVNCTFKLGTWFLPDDDTRPSVYSTPRLLKAFRAATEARFEHGERG